MSNNPKYVWKGLETYREEGAEGHIIAQILSIVSKS